MQHGYLALPLGIPEMHARPRKSACFLGFISQMFNGRFLFVIFGLSVVAERSVELTKNGKGTDELVGELG